MSNKKPSLGRGLNSLIPDKKTKKEEIKATSIPVKVTENNENDNIKDSDIFDSELIMVHPDQIESNPMQPRTNFKESALRELMESIQQHGLLQPIVVSQKEDGRYQVIVGERRWRAAKELNLDKIPVVIREADDKEKLELALIENIIREDLNPIETALAYKKLIEEFRITHDEAARRVGKPRSMISNSLRLLKLPEEIKQGLREGRITDAHAIIIAGLDSEQKQLEVYRQVLDRRLSVQRMRREIEKIGGTKEARLKIDPRDEEMMKELRQYLGTRVDIKRAGYGGKITIDFYSYDELLEIVDKILRE